jgi:hypothetical protein
VRFVLRGTLDAYTHVGGALDAAVDDICARQRPHRDEKAMLPSHHLLGRGRDHWHGHRRGLVRGLVRGHRYCAASEGEMGTWERPERDKQHGAGEDAKLSAR